MTILVSRESISANGKKMCSRCARRPPAPGQRWCRPCFTDYERDRRAGTVQVQLTPGEWEAVKRARAAGWPVG